MGVMWFIDIIHSSYHHVCSCKGFRINESFWWVQSSIEQAKLTHASIERFISTIMMIYYCSTYIKSRTVSLANNAYIIIDKTCGCRLSAVIEQYLTSNTSIVRFNINNSSFSLYLKIFMIILLLSFGKAHF